MAQRWKLITCAYISGNNLFVAQFYPEKTGKFVQEKNTVPRVARCVWFIERTDEITGRLRSEPYGLCSNRKKGKRCAMALSFHILGRISTMVRASGWRHDAFFGGSWIDGVLVRP